MPIVQYDGHESCGSPSVLFSIFYTLALLRDNSSPETVVPLMFFDGPRPGCARHPDQHNIRLVL